LKFSSDVNFHLQTFVNFFIMALSKKFFDRRTCSCGERVKKRETQQNLLGYNCASLQFLQTNLSHVQQNKIKRNSLITQSSMSSCLYTCFTRMMISYQMGSLVFIHILKHPLIISCIILFWGREGTKVNNANKKLEIQ